MSNDFRGARKSCSWSRGSPGMGLGDEVPHKLKPFCKLIGYVNSDVLKSENEQNTNF